MKKALLLLLVAAVLVFGGPAHAAEITVLNNSFEDPALDDGTQTSLIAGIINWTTVPGINGFWSGVRDPLAGEFNTVPQGDNVAFLGLSNVYTYQDLTETIVAGCTYTLTGWVSNFLSTQPSGGTLQLFTSDGDWLAQASATTNNGIFLPLTATYTADSTHEGEYLRIILAYTPGNGYGFVIWDDIHLTKTTPEVVPLPGAVWLLGSGLLGLAGLRRLRKG